MAHSRSNEILDARRMNRRQFGRTLCTATAAGTVGAAASGFGLPIHAQGAAGQQTGSDEFTRPASLRSGAQLDSRFRVSFAATVSNGFRLVTDYFTALSERNLDALASTLHFPFAICEDIEPIVVDRAPALIATPPPSLNVTGKGKTRLMPGSYDLLESMNVHLYCPVGGVFSPLLHALHT